MSDEKYKKELAKFHENNPNFIQETIANPEKSLTE